MLYALAVLIAPLARAAIAPNGCDESWRTQAVTQSFDYNTDIQPIWNQFCANCHVAHGGSPSAGLDLDAAFSYSNMVGAPNNDLSILLVAPGDAQSSLLWRKINCTAPGPSLNGARMPLARAPLNASLQALIYDWITAGAPRTLERIFASDLEDR
jgi:hypothetical protein